MYSAILAYDDPSNERKVLMVTFTPKEILAAVKTCCPHCTEKARLPALLVEGSHPDLTFSKESRVLDFGAGRQARATHLLRSAGFKHVTAYDFPENQDENHSPTALAKIYDLVFASNVLNVQPSLSMLWRTLYQISTATSWEGVFVCNYPTSPRKLPKLTSRALELKLLGAFQDVKKVSVKYNGDIYRCERPR